MAKLTGPLMSLEAVGTIGKTITYKRHGSAMHARVYKKPTTFPDPKTPKQLFVRDYFADIVSIWHAGAQSLRDAHALKAKKLKMTGYNLYISDYTYQRPSQVGNIRLGHTRLRVLT